MNSYSESDLLSTLTVRAGRTDELRIKFLQIVQTSELSYLTNTLDNGLVTFISQVLD